MHVDAPAQFFSLTIVNKILRTRPAHTLYLGLITVDESCELFLIASSAEIFFIPLECFAFAPS